MAQAASIKALGPLERLKMARTWSSKAIKLLVSVGHGRTVRRAYLAKLGSYGRKSAGSSRYGLEIIHDCTVAKIGRVLPGLSPAFLKSYLRW